jgi:hypothetical protein
MSLDERCAAELAAGLAAQKAGNHGRARVCARRAAGWAVRAWYEQREGPGWGGDALRQLRRLEREPAAPGVVREAAARLTTKVDLEHKLPFDDDPLEDARQIVQFVSTARGV